MTDYLPDFLKASHFPQNHTFHLTDTIRNYNDRHSPLYADSADHRRTGITYRY